MIGPVGDALPRLGKVQKAGICFFRITTTFGVSKSTYEIAWIFIHGSSVQSRRILTEICRKRLVCRQNDASAR